MEEQIVNYTALLKKQIAQLKKKGVDWKLWKSTTANLLQRIFGENSHQLEQLEAIKHETNIGLSGYIYRDNIEECLSRAKGLIQAHIEELYNFGLPVLTETKAEETTKSQEIALITDILEYELTGRQHQELMQIVKKEGMSETEKMEALTDKMKTLSNEVVAHILARILVACV